MSDNPVFNLFDAPGFTMGPEGSKRFKASMAPAADELNLEGIGCRYLVVEPGMRAFPFHNHLGNDELFIILEGTGTFRFGDKEYPVRPGDACPAPRGGPDMAHQIVNTGDGPLRYLAISTRNDPDVIEYPDSNKFAALAVRPGPNFFRAHLRFIGRKEDSIDYFDGEEV